MNKSVSASTRLLAVIVSGILFHTQLVFAAGCDLPMFRGARLFPSVTGSQMLATGDFNHDGFIDLAVANGPGGIISILLGNGDGTFLPSVNYASGGFASWIGVADFNGDGKPDLTDGLGIALGKGDGTFQPIVRVQGLLGTAGIVAVGDVNGDGK